LEIGDREALTRALRDKRFDGTLNRLLGVGGEGLTTKQIDTMTNAYLRRMVSHNAETLSRTTVLESMKVGNRLAWEEAVDKGFVDGGRLMKRWSTVLDGRERPEHNAMNGKTAPFDGTYENGDSYAGEGDPWNCRCIDVFFQSREAA
jgi:phage terminase large subunit GpA-like protein